MKGTVCGNRLPSEERLGTTEIDDRKRSGISYIIANPLNRKRRPLYLKPQSVPRCKHFSSGL